MIFSTYRKCYFPSNPIGKKQVRELLTEEDSLSWPLTGKYNSIIKTFNFFDNDCDDNHDNDSDDDDNHDNNYDDKDNHDNYDDDDTTTTTIMMLMPWRRL